MGSKTRLMVCSFYLSSLSGPKRSLARVTGCYIRKPRVPFHCNLLSYYPSFPVSASSKLCSTQNPHGQNIFSYCCALTPNLWMAYTEKPTGLHNIRSLYLSNISSIFLLRSALRPASVSTEIWGLEKPDHFPDLIIKTKEINHAICPVNIRVGQSIHYHGLARTKILLG